MFNPILSGNHLSQGPAKKDTYSIGTNFRESFIYLRNIILASGVCESL